MGLQNGGGFWGDVWDGIKKVGGIIKDNKLLSGGLSLIPHPYAQLGAKGAGMLGLGRKRKKKVVRRRRVLT